MGIDSLLKAFEPKITVNYISNDKIVETKEHNKEQFIKKLKTVKGFEETVRIIEAFPGDATANLDLEELKKGI